jgi:hypothetical protein
VFDPEGLVAILTIRTRNGAPAHDHHDVRIDQAVLNRCDAIVADFSAIVPGDGVISSAAEMLPYESVRLTAYRQPPR